MQRLKNALANTGLPFAAYAWNPHPTGDYGVYGLDSGYALKANHRTVETAVQATVDYFTRSDGETVKETVEGALGEFEFVLNSVQYEEDTKYLHFEWLVNLYGKS